MSPKISPNVKLVVFVPLTHTDVVREALANAGAGQIGNYSGCSFSSRGVGRYKPEAGANPHIGAVGKFESVEEERIEVLCPRKDLPNIIAAMKGAHPYDEVAYDIYTLEDA